MVHNLTDRKLWRRQGEEYLRTVRSKPLVHPLIVVAQATRGARAKDQEQQNINATV
jgi:hypothetical protein